MRRTVKELKFRRRRGAATNYKKRFALVKSGINRIVVRKTNKRVIGEIVGYEEKGDKVLAYADSNELKKYNWPSRSNRPTAYLTGMLLAKKAKALAKEELILDIGLSSPVVNSVPFVFAKGCADGGLKVRSNLKIDEKVYNYSNTTYAKELKEKNPEAYKKQYSEYLKNNIQVDALHSLFNQVKEKIQKG
jgi:large subunit ribosomal protein L18